MQLGSSGFKRVEQAFLAAAVEPTLWNDAMNVVARESGSVGSILLPVDTPTLCVPLSSSLAETSEYYFRHDWHLRDERYRGIPIMKHRGVMVDSDFFRDEEIDRHPYYQEFLAPFGHRWFAGVAIRTPDGFSAISIQRSIAQGRFTAREQDILARWGHSLSISATLAHHLAHARTRGAFDLLEAMGTSAILLDSYGRSIRANRQAEQLFSHEFGICNRQISISHRRASEEVAATVRFLLHSREIRALGPLVVPREARRPLILRLLRIDAQDGNPFSPARLVVLVTDLESQKLPRVEELSRLFGLTAAEAKLANVLSRGVSPGRAAQELGIARETARNQLKAIFTKSNTHRQSELVALLSRVSAIDMPHA
jgi:DNA-binding CsgD family transcriptional regulator